MGLPNPSRETKFSGANGDREEFIFPFQLAEHGQDWQPYPVETIHICIHTAVVTHICQCSSEPCTNVHVPK